MKIEELQNKIYQTKHFDEIMPIVELEILRSFEDGFNKGEIKQRDRIIDLIENMKIEPTPDAEGTDVDDTMRTINNTLSDVVNKIKNG